jgi:hypothetical protein
VSGDFSFAVGARRRTKEKVDAETMRGRSSGDKSFETNVLKRARELILAPLTGWNRAQLTWGNRLPQRGGSKLKRRCQNVLKPCTTTIFLVYKARFRIPDLQLLR